MTDVFRQVLLKMDVSCADVENTVMVSNKNKALNAT